jgi:hypothetical protein
MELDTPGDRKTALFIIISDTDTTFNFVAALMYSQLFNMLCDKADNVYNGRLPVHVRFLLDEFANIGTIPNFDKLIATIRSREISACVILQAQSQLKNMYKDNAETIIGNMDTRLFLGGSEKTTLKDLSESLGKETIDLLNNSVTKGNSPSFGQNYQKLGKDVLPCKGVESTTHKLHGSSFICGKDGRLPERKKDLPAQEQFGHGRDVIRCAEKYFEEIFKMCSDLPPVFLLYMRGCNTDTTADGYAKPTWKGGFSVITNTISNNISVYQPKSN